MADDVRERLDVIAGDTQRGKSSLAAEAIRAGGFASEKDVAALAKKWKVNAVRWVRKALRNLDDEASFVTADDAAAARIVIRRVLEAVSHLAK